MATKHDRDDESPARALLAALLAMAGVAVVVGLAVGLVAAGALGGVGDGAGEAEEAEASLYMPEYQPTESSSAEDWPQLPAVSEEASPEPASKPAKSNEIKRSKQDKITLVAAPQSVSPGERINLNGVYVDGEGVALQVQRREGGSWTDFPVQANVRGGAFETWIQTSRTGEQRFRVADPTTDRASNAVRVTVG